MEKGFTSADRDGSQSDNRPRVSVIIVTYRSSNELPACIASLLDQSVPAEIFLVDNASPDDTAEVVTDYAKQFDNIHAILNKENIGLAAANNLPIGKCQGDYVLILNPDTLLRNNTLSRLVTFLDRNLDIGIVGPKNVYADGKPHSSSHRHWGIRHVLLWRILPYRFSRWLYDRFSNYKCQDKLFVSGACLMIRRSTFECIGGYDPEYFLTVEDACDVCIRARKTGGRVVFLPDAEVVHLGGRSGAQTPFVVVWHGYNGSIYHFLKHKGKGQALIVLTLLLMSACLRCVIASAMAVFKQRYRNIAHIYARVFWSLMVRNPLQARAVPPCGSEPTESVRLDGAPF